MSLSDKLTSLNNAKQNLKTAFTNLGFDMSSVPFTDYHTLLAKLVKGVSTTLTSTISSTSVHFGATLTITGTLKDENSTVLTGETITLKDGNNTLNTTTTDNSGAYSFTYTVSSMTSPNLNVAFKSKGFYLSSISTIPTITVVETVLYNPSLSGSESITTIGSNVSPIISNNTLSGGCGYLTEGWSNSTKWKLTFTYNLLTDAAAIVPLIVKGTNQRDYNCIQLVNSDGLIVNTNSTYETYSGCEQPNYNTEYTATFTKTGSNTITFDLGTGGTASFTWSALSAAPYLCIGLDYLGGCSDCAYVKNIKVVQV